MKSVSEPRAERSEALKRSEATAAGEREPEQHSSTVLSEAVPWTEEGYERLSAATKERSAMAAWSSRR